MYTYPIILFVSCVHLPIHPCCFLQITVKLFVRKGLVKTLSLREKINYLGFSPKFYCNIIAFQGFQIRKFFCDISFRLQDIVKILVFRFFLTVHIFKFLIMPFLQCLQSSSSGIRICLNFFHILHH